MIKDLHSVLLLLFMMSLTACVNEMDAPFEGECGQLRLSLSNISTAVTRSTPAELGKPQPENFWVRITNTVGRAVYDNVFTDESLTLPVGDYTIVATYGYDNLLAEDRPYYIGQTTASIQKDMDTNVKLMVSVGNALVSVRFGADEEERARFDRFYSDYAVRVCVGINNMSITKNETGKSIYVRAGSHVTLKFWGKLKMEDDREVSCELSSEEFPEVLNAADHAIVTLGLPDPESALGVDISKVEVETKTLDETIPFSWLPIPVITPTLQFDDEGNLLGTLLTSNNGYPGMTWRAVVTNAAGTEVRTLQGTGVLTSNYASSTSWPYLPQGTYTATYYIISEDGSAMKASSRDFTISAPTGLNIAVTGYTSYDKYLAGDIDAANNCERATIYEPSVKVNISSALLNNSNISKSFTYTYDGTTANVTTGNAYAPGNLTNQSARSSAYVLKGDLTFDGVSLSAQKEFRITGLPYAINFVSHGEWSNSRDREIHWESGSVRLGQWATNTAGQTITNNTSVNIPQGTKYCASYAVNVRTGTAGTTFTITAGNQEMLSISESGKLFDLTGTDHQHTSTTATYTANSNITSLVCKNSWGDGQSCTIITSLIFKYGR